MAPFLVRSLEDAVALRLARLQGDVTHAPQLAAVLAHHPVSRGMAAVARLRHHTKPSSDDVVRDLVAVLEECATDACVAPSVVGLTLEGYSLGMAVLSAGTLVLAEKDEVWGTTASYDRVERCAASALDAFPGSVLAVEERSAAPATLRGKGLATIQRVASSHGSAIHWLPPDALMSTFGEPSIPRRKLRSIASSLWPNIQPRGANGAVLDAAAIAFAVHLQIATAAS